MKRTVTAHRVVAALMANPLLAFEVAQRLKVVGPWRGNVRRLPNGERIVSIREHEGVWFWVLHKPEDHTDHGTLMGSGHADADLAAAAADGWLIEQGYVCA